MNATEEKKAQETEQEVQVETITFKNGPDGGELNVSASPQATMYVMTCLIDSLVDSTGMDPDLIMNQIMRDLKHKKMSQKMSEVSCDLKNLFSHLSRDEEGGEEENN